MKKYQEKNQKYEKKRKKFKSVTYFFYDDAKKEVSTSVIFHTMKYLVHVKSICVSGSSYFLMDEI
jgi:hypothetical protein